MSSTSRRHSTWLLAFTAFVAALLPLAATTAWFLHRGWRLADETTALERRLAQLEARLAPVGHLERLRGDMLARKTVADVLQEPQLGLQAALAVLAQIPANTRLVALDIDSARLSLQFAGIDSATATHWIEQLGQAGFSDAAAGPADDRGTVALTARIDPAHLSAAARPVTP